MSFSKKQKPGIKMRAFFLFFQEILRFYGILYSYELIYSKKSKRKGAFKSRMHIN